jgi:hypothetical protein
MLWNIYMGFCSQSFVKTKEGWLNYDESTGGDISGRMLIAMGMIPELRLRVFA